MRLTIASGVSGCLWGIGLVLLLPEPLLYRLFIAFVLGGMAAGSVVTLSPLLPVVTAFLLPCMLPLTIRLALEGSPVWLGMSALTLLFTCGLWAAAWKLNSSISTMLHLKMEKSQLADELSSVLADLERKVERRTADLRLARDEANRANQMKTRFLAAASHDLGQPFQAMRLFIDLLDKRLQGSPHYEYLQALDQAHLSGQRMLTSLLDLSRLESGTVQLRVESFPVGDLLDRLETEFRPLAESRGLRLRIRGCDCDIVSDPVLLHQIVANLLGNALRYTTSGGILLACRRRGHDDPAGSVGYRGRDRRRPAGGDLRGIPPDRHGRGKRLSRCRAGSVHRSPDGGPAQPQGIGVLASSGTDRCFRSLCHAIRHQDHAAAGRGRAARTAASRVRAPGDRG